MLVSAVISAELVQRFPLTSVDVRSGPLKSILYPVLTTVLKALSAFT